MKPDYMKYDGRTEEPPYSTEGDEVSASELNALLSDQAIEVLRNRKGFRDWWDNLDCDMQLDVQACLHERFLQINGR